jgi:sugar O-acyltransferase (sialic acid O-acetyltransferase NeuD family)
MSKKNIIIAGASGHAKVIMDIIEKGSDYHILGLVDKTRPAGEDFFGYKILGKEEDLPQLVSGNPCEFFVAIGNNWRRSLVASKIIVAVPEARFATAVHPSAQIGRGVRIGAGVAIMAGAIVNSDSHVGDFAIVNTHASMDHDCRMMAYTSLAPGAVLGGNVTIGEHTAVAIGATVRNDIRIGKHSLIGAGALLNSDCPDYAVMYGVPAKFIRSREAGE